MGHVDRGSVSELAMTRNYLKSVWYTLEEPRVITALMIAAYAGTAGLGVTIMQGLGGEGTLAVIALRGLVGGLLLFAGFTGFPAAWKGAHWLERLSALATAGGYGAWAIHLAGSHLNKGIDLAAPVTTVVAMVVCVIFAVTRFARVVQNPYALGKGPMLPEVEARLQANLNDPAR